VAEKITFKVSSAAAPFLGADKPLEDRLKAAAGQVRLPATDFVLLLYYLCHDTDPEVKRTAMATLRGLDVPFLSHLLSNPELHPRILDALVQLHFKKPELAPLFAAHPMLSEKAANFLIGKGIFPGLSDVPEEEPAPDSAPSPVSAAAPEQRGRREAYLGEEEAGEVGESPDSDEPVNEETEQFQSKYQMAMNMGVGEKIKAAMTGDKEWRTILIKDSNKLVSVAVVRNPRITDGEVLTIAKSAVQNEEIMRVICANKDWVKNAKIRRALVENAKTPLPAALRFVSTLSEKELSSLARNRNVSSVVASQARRLLMNKKEGR
jgi:hypothetical protein